MNIIESPLSGAWLVCPERNSDSRGFFTRSFCSKEFTSKGLCHNFYQCNISFNHLRGTIRGMHYSLPLINEAKLVRCTTGAIFDVIVDIRPESSSFGKWFGTRLTAQNRIALYIPVGFAHGFQTLEDECEVFYQMGDYYNSSMSRGFIYSDPEISINWPIEKKIISQKDSELPNFNQLFF